MSVDIETEVVQLWAAIRVIASVISSKLPSDKGGLTLSTVGLRSRSEHELAGLAQILELSESFALELAIKALYSGINPNDSPRKTHDLLQLFDSLSKDVKTQLNAKWQNADGRSTMAQQLTLNEFLRKYRSLFEDSRYLYEEHKSTSTSSMDFEIALWMILHELIERCPDDTTLPNVLNMLKEDQS